jgi:hypothetical protein
MTDTYNAIQYVGLPCWQLNSLDLHTSGMFKLVCLRAMQCPFEDGE